MSIHLVGPDGCFSDAEIAFVAARARGGAGLLISGCLQAEDKFEPASPAMVQASDDRFVARLHDFADAVHAHGAKVGAQLTVGFGLGAAPSADLQPISASAVPSALRPDVLCRALEPEEIAEMVDLFGQAAARCVTAGFDAIDIHAHTGDLAEQFMSSHLNKRTDTYGGSLENRMRLCVELVQATREAIGPDHTISVRLSADEKLPGGRTVDETTEMARMLAAAGADVLSLDAGGLSAPQWMCPSYYFGDDPNVALFHAVRAAVDIPVAGAGNLTPMGAEEAIRDGFYDFMGSARGLIADPDWPNRLLDGHPEDIRPCIRCNEMCLGKVMAGKSVECSVNPQAGRELSTQLIPADQGKKIVIIGGGPAGLEAARVAGLRGHRVRIYEQESRLGGVLEPAARSDFKRELHRMVGWWEHQIDTDAVSVSLETTVTAASGLFGDADEIIVATGSVPQTPAILGLNLPHVLDVLDFHREPLPAGEHIVVCGGGLSGCDAALDLAQHGKQVVIIEMLGAIATAIVPPTRIALLGELSAAGVGVLTDTTVLEITASAVLAKGPDGAVSVDADTVITAFGVSPQNALAAKLQAAGIDAARIHVIGDAARPAKVGDAIHAGFNTALVL
jgi:2,4-dienoyl-CoA reductase-like NADH-dependent reductase (Old Yellow Enzyme family)/thioredoxin reductase